MFKVGIATSALLGLATIVYFGAPQINSVQYQKENNVINFANKLAPIDAIAIHLPTPKPLRGIYMTSWVAGTPSFRTKLVKLIEETELNAVIIDIKDYTGRISFKVSNPELTKWGAVENRIPDIFDFIDDLHKKNIYVIGRISVFQDPYLIKKRPELAVKKESNRDAVWQDHKGIGWLDAGSKEVWDYHVAIAKEAYDVGFDELNFDYIRFPSDGNMKDIYYPISEGKIKAEVIRDFFKYLRENLSNPHITISADLFGMTTTNKDDLNIGQVLENTTPYFDYIAPMVYPSHYPATWNGFKNPAANPYEVVKIAMSSAVERLKIIGDDPFKLRPWLQDFNLGATYTKDLVRAQMTATYDSGLDSWVLWDPKNIYTAPALNLEI